MSFPHEREAVVVSLPNGVPDGRTFLRMLGPAYLVAVGYLDPGNWATDLAAGSRYGFRLLWVVALSSLMAMVLQSLSCRLGIATGMDLALCPVVACCPRAGGCPCGCWRRWRS